VGLLQAGRTVALPPNFLPGTLSGLEREADGVLWETRPGTARPAPLDGDLEFWTSGSTGEPKGVVRSVAQAEAEVALLERAFGHLMPEGPVVGTVPHHHIYGCLFRILWPLAAGRPFLCEPAGDPAAFLRALAQPAPVALVASPAHLSRLPRLMDLDSLPLAKVERGISRLTGRPGASGVVIVSSGSFCPPHVAHLEMDTGPILAQATVAILPDDTEASLHERIKAVERTLYPATIRSFIDGLASQSVGAGRPPEHHAPEETTP